MTQVTCSSGFFSMLQLALGILSACAIQDEYKFILLISLVELTFHNMTVQMTVSEHGGVVREPRYRP